MINSQYYEKSARKTCKEKSSQQTIGKMVTADHRRKTSAKRSQAIITGNHLTIIYRQDWG
jgi:hypothetical protein